MSRFKIGVISDSFKCPLRESIAMAKEAHATGVQIHAVSADMALENLDRSAKNELKKYVTGLGLEISALCGDLGGHGFQNAGQNTEKITRSKKIVEIASELDTRVVTAHIGVIAQDQTSRTYINMTEACREIGKHAAQFGVCFAIETGPESAAQLKTFIEHVDSKGIGVNLDPANLVMVVGDDPVQAVYTLKDYIVHTHAKDGIQLQPCDPRQVYDAFATGGFEQLVATTGDLFREMPLGKGSVDWPAYLSALEDIGYAGYLTIERETGQNPAQDIQQAVQFLKSLI